MAYSVGFQPKYPDHKTFFGPPASIKVHGWRVQLVLYKDNVRYMSTELEHFSLKAENKIHQA